MRHEFIALDGSRTVIDLPDPVPSAVPLWKARVILSQAPHSEHGNLLAAVQAGASPAVAAWLEYGSEIERHHPSTVALGAALGLTDAQMDALFVAAEQVQPA